LQAEFLQSFRPPAIEWFGSVEPRMQPFWRKAGSGDSTRCSTRFLDENQARGSMRSQLSQCFMSRMPNTIRKGGIISSCFGQPEQQGVYHLPRYQSGFGYDVGDGLFEGSPFHMRKRTFVLELMISSGRIRIFDDA